MFTYTFNTSEYTELLQYLSLFLLFVIGVMIYYMSNNTSKMGSEIKNQISNLDLECPACPDHPTIPTCPTCPKCPDLECNEGICPQCPACPVSENVGSCPACPACPNADCPSVDDIVTGLFPGRNPGITSGGNYFDIQASDSYELMPNYDMYNPVDAFPSDSILSVPDSLIQGNVDVVPTQIDNTGNSGMNNMINTDQDVSLSRMNMAPPGESTGADSNSQESLMADGSMADGSSDTDMTTGATGENTISGGE
jgi:hypothetical protein